MVLGRVGTKSYDNNYTTTVTEQYNDNDSGNM